MQTGLVRRNASKMMDGSTYVVFDLRAEFPVCMAPVDGAIWGAVGQSGVARPQPNELTKIADNSKEGWRTPPLFVFDSPPE